MLPVNRKTRGDPGFFGLYSRSAVAVGFCLFGVFLVIGGEDVFVHDLPAEKAYMVHDEAEINQ